MESQLHRELVALLVAYAESAEMEILAVDGVPGRRRPWRIGSHRPDMIARDARGRLVCGEAKCGYELERRYVQHQLHDFSRANRLRGTSPRRLLLCVPATEAERALDALWTSGASLSRTSLLLSPSLLPVQAVAPRRRRRGEAALAAA
jgi:hypothetical protein